MEPEELFPFKVGWEVVAHSDPALERGQDKGILNLELQPRYKMSLRELPYSAFEPTVQNPSVTTPVDWSFCQGAVPMPSLLPQWQTAMGVVSYPLVFCLLSCSSRQTVHLDQSGKLRGRS